MQGLALTHTRTHTPLHINTCVCFQSLTKKKYTQVQTLTNITVRPEFGLLSASVPLKNQLSFPLIKPVSFTWTPPPRFKSTVQPVKSSLTGGPLVLNALARHL